MEEYKQSVINEKNEFDKKISDLISFMHGDNYPLLPAVEQGLLMVQLVAMDNYLNALERRIELF